MVDWRVRVGAAAALAAATLHVTASCGPQRQTGDDDGDSGAAASHETDTASSASGGSAGSSQSGTGNGGDGAGGAPVPCQPLADADHPSPTDGKCEANHAVICNQQGYLEQERCAQGYECRSYPLKEWRFDGLAVAWVAARNVTWAGCVPEGAASCDMAFNGSYYQSDEPPHCEGSDRIRCGLPPVPNLFSGSPQLQYGTDTAVLYVEGCPNGERCAGSDTLDQLTCIDENTPACTGAEPFCDGADAITYCQGTWESLPGYQVRVPCAGSNVCYEGTIGPFCRAPGEQPCDDATYEEACTSGNSDIIDCYGGYTYHQSCASCRDRKGNDVPCRCDDVTTLSGGVVCQASLAPQCVPVSAGDCDPSVDADVCVADAAHRCRGYWDVIDCAALGMECAVNGNVAGCRAPSSPACTIGSWETCDGTEVVGCCPCSGDGYLAGPGTPPCVPGYTIRSDCSDWGADYICDDDTFFAHCVQTGT